MKAIKFNTIAFELKNEINVSASRLAASLVKGEYGVDDVIAELDGTETATIIEDGETVAVYNDYSKILAVTYVKDYENEVPVDIINVELINEDIQSQIDALSGVVNNVQSVQTSHSNSINNLNGEVSRKLDAGIIGDVEVIGGAASRPYKVDETFAGSDGKMYKAIVPILTNDTLVLGGNCEETSISEELKVEE